MQDKHSPFIHRHNYNGTYDSICTACFLTVASNIIEQELVDDEENHSCLGLNGGTTLQRVNERMLQRFSEDKKPKRI